jgi:hypothetical protein
MRFLISEEEKSRILSMHQNATSRQYLNEADAPVDPAWLKKAKDSLMSQNTYEYLAIGILKAGTSYAMPQTTLCVGRSEYGSGDNIGVIAKGATWKPGPALTVAYCPMKVFNINDLGVMGDLQKITADVLQKLAAGTYTVGGKAIQGQTSNAVWYPSISNLICTTGGKLMQMAVADKGNALRTALMASSQSTGEAAPSGQYKG